VIASGSAGPVYAGALPATAPAIIQTNEGSSKVTSSRIKKYLTVINNAHRF
jgi:hypothetical protein